MKFLTVLVVMLLMTNTNRAANIVVDAKFSSDPQVATAVAVTEKFLARMGTQYPVSLRKNADVVGYRLRVASGNVTIEAADAEGARCGLMSLLHRLGVRWYDPSDEPLIPPPPVTLEDFEEEKQPSFPYRGLHICAVRDHYDERMIEWMSFNGMNRKLAHVPELARVGVDLRRHGIAPDTTVHSYTEWVPDAEYFESNPEFFAMQDGKRIRQGDGGQLCLSNAEMRAAFIRNVRKFLDEHPETAVIGICPNDGYGWCECEECAKLDSPEDRANGTMNARVAFFVEEVCEALKESHPGVLVGHYAYSIFLDFHKFLKNPPSNLMVSCTTFRCCRHAIDDARCETNQKIFNRLRELRSIVKHVYVYDYMFHRWEGLPHPQWRVVEKDIAAYAKLGLDGYMTEILPALSGDFEGGHLPLYVMAKLLYDRDTDVDTLLDDYCTRRFGEAAKIMRSYLALWEETVNTMEGCLTRKGDDLERLLSPKLMTEGRKLLNEGAKVATSAYRQAVLRESGLFDRWTHILKERGKVEQTASLKVGSMEEFRRDRENEKQNDDGILFLDNTLKIAPPDNHTRARFYADKNTLGIVIECREKEADKISDKPGNSLGAVYGSENVEIFLRDGKDALTCYHALISISGGHLASECRGTRWNWAWEGEYRVKTTRSENGWKVFFEIPLSKINVREKAALTLIRNRYVDGWQKSGIPDGGAFFNVEKYLELNLPEDMP